MLQSAPRASDTGIVTTGVSGAADGTTSGADALLARYRADFTVLVRLAYLLLDDKALAAAVVDESFVRVARGRGAVPTTADWRRGVVAGAREAAPAVATAPAPAAGADPVLDVFRTLPFAQRAALVLHHVGALGDDDIAHAAGAPHDEVRAHAEAGLRAIDAALRAAAA